MPQTNERLREHLEECLLELGRVLDLVRDDVKHDKGVLGIWTDLNGLRELNGAVESACQLIALLPPEEGAAPHLAPLTDCLHALERLQLAHRLDPHRTFGPEAGPVRDVVRNIRRACDDLEVFLKERLV